MPVFGELVTLQLSFWC